MNRRVFLAVNNRTLWSHVTRHEQAKKRAWKNLFKVIASHTYAFVLTYGLKPWVCIAIASQALADRMGSLFRIRFNWAHHTFKLICACIGLVKKCLIDLWKFAIWISINNFVDTFKTVRLLSLQVQSEKHLLQTSSLCRVQGPQEEHLELFLGKQKRKQMDYTNVIMANALNLKLGVRIIRFKNTFLSRWRLFDHRRETMVVLTRLV